MRGFPVLLLLCVGAVLTGPSSAALAADNGATAERRAVHYSRARVVRDYDGTPVVERRVRLVRVQPDGTTLVTERTEMIAAPRATPTRWLNGEPVLPQSRPIGVR
jgi:hypothetical protein